MKKINWKRWLTMGLALTMSAFIAGCNNKQNDPNDPNGQVNENNPAANAALAKQYVYDYKELDFAKDVNDYSVVATKKTGDRIEILIQSYNYESYYGEQNLTLYSMKSDGTDVTSVDMYVEKPEYNGYEEGESEGDGLMQENGLILPEPVGVITDDDNYDPGDYSYENTYYNSACLSDDGVYALKNHVKESYKNGEYVSENDYTIICWNRDGSVRSEAPFDMTAYQNDDTYSYISNMFYMGDGSVGLLLSGDVGGVVTVDKDGKASAIKKTGSDKDIFSNDPRFAERADGTFLVSYYNDDWSKMFITTFDPKTGNVGEEKEIPAAARNRGMYDFCAGSNKDVVFASSDGIYGFNLGEEDVTKIMDFINSDFESNGLNGMVIIDDTHFMASYYDTVEYNNQMALFSYVKPEDIQDKKVLVYAAIYVSSDAKQAIIRFNKKETDYRITIKDYSIYNTDEDYTLGETKLNNDIIAGNIPDIFEIQTSMPMDSYVAKGLLANIDEMIKNDPELSKQEYMDNVFEAYRINGVLYRVIPKYNLCTWIGKKSLVGNRTGWTMQEVRQAASSLTGEKSLFGQDLIREEFLNKVMNYCGSDFVDVNTGKCNFENQNFIDILEYAKTLPVEYKMEGDDEYWNHYWETYQSQYRENRTLLMELYLYDMSNMKYQVNGMIGEDVSYIGFPCEGGNGSYIGLMTNYALYEKSENKEGAWKFLRTFLTEDYQKNEDYKYGYSSGLPVLKTMVREMADKTMEKPYWIDENGNKQEWDDTYYINGQEIIIDPFTKQQADELYNFVCSVKKPAYYDENVIKIVTEETDAFFSGSISAQGAASNIQNRVQLYVNENR